MWGLRLEVIKWLVKDTQGFQVAVVVKNLPVNTGDIRDGSSILGSGRSPEAGHHNPLKYSCLENPIDRGAWWVTVHGVIKSWTNWSDLACTRVCKDTYGANGRKKTRGLAFWPWDVCVIMLLIREGGRSPFASSASQDLFPSSSCSPSSSSFPLCLGASSSWPQCLIPPVSSLNKSSFYWSRSCWKKKRETYIPKATSIVHSVSHSVVSDSLWPHGL